MVDEFSYYCDERPELPSVLQRWWDRMGARTKVMTVLAGSHVAFMERLVLGGQALYRRRTGELRLQPFDYANHVFSRSGFDPTLVARAGVEKVWLVTPALMFTADICEA